jgi:WD40 repeat protein
MKIDSTFFELLFDVLGTFVFSGHPYHAQGLTCMAISPDSTCALTGSKDGSVCIVNITTGRVSTFTAFNILMLYFCVNHRCFG